jgi:hypothetical protein
MDSWLLVGEGDGGQVIDRVPTPGAAIAIKRFAGIA